MSKVEGSWIWFLLLSGLYNTYPEEVGHDIYCTWPVTIILVRRKFWSRGTKISEKFGPPLKIVVRADDRALREQEI